MASGREEVPASLNSAALLCSGWGACGSDPAAFGFCVRL